MAARSAPVRLPSASLSGHTQRRLSDYSASFLFKYSLTCHLLSPFFISQFLKWLTHILHSMSFGDSLPSEHALLSKPMSSFPFLYTTHTSCLNYTHLSLIVLLWCLVRFVQSQLCKPQKGIADLRYYGLITGVKGGF